MPYEIARFDKESRTVPKFRFNKCQSYILHTKISMYYVDILPTSVNSQMTSKLTPGGAKGLCY